MKIARIGALALAMGLSATSVAADYHEAYAEVLVGLSTKTESSRLAYLSARPGKARKGNADQKLQTLIEAYWAWQMQAVPEYATYTGYPGQNDRWSSYTQAEQGRQDVLVRQTLEALQGIDEEALSAANRLNYQLLDYQLKQEVTGQTHPERYWIVNQMYGVHTQIPQILSSMPLFTAEDRANYLSRLRAIPQLLEEVTAVLREGLDKGITPPQIAIKKVPPQVAGMLSDEPADSPLLKALKGSPDTLNAAESIYRERVRPAFEAFQDFLESQYVPGAVKATGIGQLPGGKDWYAWRAEKMTTTTLSPQAIHDIGLAEVERIRAEMQKVMQEMGKAGMSIPEFAAYLAKDPAQFYDKPEDLVRDYRALAKQADGELVQLFSRFPSLPYAVEAIPAHEAAGRSAAYYRGGSVENGRPGTFYVNASRLPESPKYEMTALVLHEGVPGHHFQIALAQEQEGLPAFRRFGRFTAYIEGWGLYAESLGEQMGMYEDPASRFGALTFEMWRAIRLVVDTGMHALGWSRQDAIDFFRDNTGRGLDRIRAEVDRYLVMPGQALSYKMGQLKILELRQQAERVLADDYDIRRFHDFILSEGALPLQVLETRFDEWLAAQTTTQ